MLPPHVRKTEAWSGEVDVDPSADPEEIEHKEWLESVFRCFRDEGTQRKYPKAHQKYRLAAYWWLMVFYF